MGGELPHDPETLGLLHFRHALRHLEAVTLAWTERDWALIRQHLTEAREDLRWALRLIRELE
jgi:hypothetical protein